MIDSLVLSGVDQAFLVTGGAAMFLNDAIARNPQIKTVACHHEQAAAMAAEAWARVSGRPALVCVTAGPGVINALNGVYGAFTDSVPMVVLSGQSRTQMTRRSEPERRYLRQIGDQEVDSIALATPVTKFAYELSMDDDPLEILTHALEVAVQGRPGPVWLSLPLDVQARNVVGVPMPSSRLASGLASSDPLDPAVVRSVANRLRAATRPTLLVGSGMKSGDGRRALTVWNDCTDIPLQPAWTAVDLVPKNHRLFAGRPGTVGDRAGGAIQVASDLVLSVGCSLHPRQVGYRIEELFPPGKLIRVDIDDGLRKVKPRLASETITADGPAFVMAVAEELSGEAADSGHLEWLHDCKELIDAVGLESSWTETRMDGINAYSLLMAVAQSAPSDAIFACADASASVILFQSADFAPGQMAFTNAGAASMGYDLPAAIGASLATDRPIFCIAGDGSIQQNVQELSVIAHLGRDIRILVLENDGYLSIRNSQRKHFGRLLAESPSTGLPLPDIVAVAKAMTLRAERVASIEDALGRLASEGPSLTAVMVSPSQQFTPRVGSRVEDGGRITSGNLDELDPVDPEDRVSRWLHRVRRT